MTGGFCVCAVQVQFVHAVFCIFLSGATFAGIVALQICNIQAYLREVALVCLAHT